jgi:hypothetical protein
LATTALIALALAGDLPARAATAIPIGGFCGAAVQMAEMRYGIPEGLLFAIGVVESGRRITGHRRPVPWPWTVQAQNRSYYFPDESAAAQWVRAAEARGVVSIDVGCLQINLMYHPQAFKTLAQAFDPASNADYAGRLLATLHAETGDWRKAAGLYHSQTHALAILYRERVADALAGRDWSGQSGAPRKPTTLSMLKAAWGATLETTVGTSTTPEEGWSEPPPPPKAQLRARMRPPHPVLLSDAH